jgi:SAM-dependent methyltransferase
MKLREQFGENSFDAVYAIEATCHAPSWEGIYGEIKHVLKPGGRVSLFKWKGRPHKQITISDQLSFLPFSSVFTSGA